MNQFKIFITILLGMTLIGAALGFVIGFYAGINSETNFWGYLSAPILAVGGGMVLYGGIYGRLSSDE